MWVAAGVLSPTNNPASHASQYDHQNYMSCVHTLTSFLSTPSLPVFLTWPISAQPAQVRVGVGEVGANASN